MWDIKNKMNASFIIQILILTAIIRPGILLNCSDVDTTNAQCVIFEGNTYYVSSSADKPDFRGAMKKCKERYGRLVELDSYCTQGFFLNMMLKNKSGGGDYWIGGTFDLNVSRWIWVTSRRPIELAIWHPGQPNSPDENCLAMWSPYSYLWVDNKCTDHYHRYICEGSVRTPETIQH